MRKLAINIIGYLDVEDKYDEYKVHQMLNRKAMTEYFPSLNVQEIVVKEIKEVKKKRK